MWWKDKMKYVFFAGLSLIFLFFITTSLLLLTAEMPSPNKEFENHPREEELISRAATAFDIATARGDSISQAINHPMVTITQVLLSRYLEGYRLDPLFFPHSHSSYPLPGIGVIPFIILPFFLLGFFFLPRLGNLLKVVLLTIVFAAPIPGVIMPWTTAALVPMLLAIYGLTAIACWFVMHDILKRRFLLQVGILLLFLLNAMYILHQWVSHQ